MNSTSSYRVRAIRKLLAVAMVIAGISVPCEAREVTTHLQMPITTWHWVHTFVTYDPSGKDVRFRSWGTLQGDVTFAIHENRFDVIIGEPRDGTDTHIKGTISGHNLTAMVFRVQTDEPGKLFKGNFGEENGAAYISLVSTDGSFIGFITQAKDHSDIQGSRY